MWNYRETGKARNLPSVDSLPKLSTIIRTAAGLSHASGTSCESPAWVAGLLVLEPSSTAFQELDQEAESEREH